MKSRKQPAKHSSVKCNICGATATHELLTIHKPDRFEKAKGVDDNDYVRKWMKCENCGVAINNRPSESKQIVNDIETSYYEIDLGNESNLRKKYDYVMSLPDNESDNAGRVARILSFLKNHFHDLNNIDICDVGCGLGIFPSKLMDVVKTTATKEINITGIEPDPISFSFVKSLDKFPVLKGYFPDAVHDQIFDLITFNKVLEHIPDPLQMVEAASEHLKRNGLVYIEVPCITNTWKKPPTNGSLGVLHYNLYSIKSLRYLIEKTDLTVLMAERIVEPSGKLAVYAIAANI